MPETLTPKRADRRYHRVFWPAMAIYVVSCFAVPFAIERWAVQGVALYALAVLPALPIGLVLVVLGRWLRETDEYIRARQVEALLYGWTITGFFTIAYGFLEAFAGAPDYPLMMVLPMFFGAYGLAWTFLWWAGR